MATRQGGSSSDPTEIPMWMSPKAHQSGCMQAQSLAYAQHPWRWGLSS